MAIDHELFSIFQSCFENFLLVSDLKNNFYNLKVIFVIIDHYISYFRKICQQS